MPALLGLVALYLDRDGPYIPYGDHGILALSVDAVGEQTVLLGAYSRFGWYHPGPMATYLLAGVQYLLGGATQGMAVGALIIAGLASALAVWLVHRRTGALTAVWTILVLALSVRTLGAGFLYDSWNPYLPVLPFLAGVLLCWAAVLGNSWALPLAVLPMSLALQAHIGFLPAVSAAGALLALGLLLRVVRRLRRQRGPSAAEEVDRPRHPTLRWLVAGIAALALAGLSWTPPIIEQMTASQGNLGKLATYLREGSPEDPAGLGAGLRGVADEFGKLPAYLVGAGSPREVLLPQEWPPAAIAVGVGLFVVALANGVRRRREDVVWLGAFTLAVAAAGVAAIARIDGFTFVYLTRWTVVVGVLAWTTVGMSLLPELRSLARRRVPPRRAGTLVGVPLTALATAAVLVTGLGTARAAPPMTDVTGQLGRLEAAVLADLDRRGLRSDTESPVVRVEFPPTSRPDDLVGTFWPGTGLVLALQRDGVDVQVSPFWRVPFGTRYTDRAFEAGYVVTLAYSDGSSPPPLPWEEILLVDGDLTVRGGVPPTG